MTSRLIPDPIYGSIEVSALENLFLHTRPMQRLRHIQQLGLVDLVFPGANHTRLAHSLGTMHVAGLLCDAVGIEDNKKKLVRLAGLVHDVGHSAYSHVVEEVLDRNPDFRPRLGYKVVLKHEDFTRHIVLEELSQAPDLEEGLEELGFDFKDLAEVATGGDHHLGQLVSGEVDADRIDYLLRDSHHAGVGLGVVDLNVLAQSLALDDDGYLVLRRGDDTYSEEMALTAAESLMIARFHHFRSLIQNPDVQCARGMLLCALEEALGSANDPREEAAKFFTEHTDRTLLNFIEVEAEERGRELIRRIESGQLYQVRHRRLFKHMDAGTRAHLAMLYTVGEGRKVFEELLSRQFGTGCLVRLDMTPGVPREMCIRVADKDRFLYDESAIVKGLVTSMSQEITLSVFTPDGYDCGLALEDLPTRVLADIRKTAPLRLEGLLLFFYVLDNVLKRDWVERHLRVEDKDIMRYMTVRVSKATDVYKMIRSLRDGVPVFDYKFPSKFSFAYDKQLYADLQRLVALEMLDEDTRYFMLKSGRQALRYMFSITREGKAYAESVAEYYTSVLDAINAYVEDKLDFIEYDVIFSK